jgi:arabinogalactan endo-1,4-beta-galactosidase
MKLKKLMSLLAIIPLLFSATTGIGNIAYAALADQSSGAGAAATSGQSIHINPIPGLSSDFMKGVDISMLKQLEEKGAAFYDNGLERDLLDILKDRDVNWIRLRIWNNPDDGNNVLDSEGRPLGVGGGYNDLATTIELSKRAKAKGFKVLLDFHYSDFWADPGKQYKPYAWRNLSGEALEQALYSYTDQVIKALKSENAMPDMVQVGNELNNGMVWNDGKTLRGSSSETIGGYDGFANLLKAGAKAVRDNDPYAEDPEKKVKVMIHLADGGDSDLYNRVFDALTVREVEYDIIGFSYYPYWHGPMDRFKQNMNEISVKYNKDVVLAETAYAYTLENGDSLSNNFGENEENEGGYRATVQGQAQLVRDVMEAVAQVPNGKGLGIFYWEPDWIPVDGAGWKDGEGNGWDNQAMFDFQGNALPSLDVFKLVSEEGPVVPATLTGIRSVQVEVPLDTEVSLPPYVKADYSDHSVKKYPVTWASIDRSLLSKPNTFMVSGTIDANGTPMSTTATVKVEGLTNYVKNPGFEKGSFADWTVSGDTTKFRVKNEGSNAYSGDYSIHYWSDVSASFIVKQTITGLKNGSYTLRARTQGDGGERLLQIFAEGYGGDRRTADIVNTKWHEWKTPEIAELKVTNGQITVGVHAEFGDGNWGNIDDFELVSDDSSQTITVPARVEPGSTFTAQLGMKRQPFSVYAQDVSLEYDHKLVEFVKAEGVKGTEIIILDDSKPGAVSLLAATKNGISTTDSAIKLVFTAKHHEGTAIFKVTKAEWGTAPSGKVHEPAILGVSQMLIEEEDEGGGTTSGSGPSTGIPPAGPDDKGVVKASAVLDTSLARATAKTSLEALRSWTSQLKEKSGSGDPKLTIDIPSVTGAKEYALELPSEWFAATEEAAVLEIVTPLGRLSVPSGMLGSDSSANGGQVGLSIGEANKSALPEAVKDIIGDRPVVQLNLLKDGKPVSWNNPDAPVTVSIPYKPSSVDASAVNYLTIWYITPDGQAVAVPNAKYDQNTESMVFSTTHFSDYAIALDRKTFGDLSAVPWAREAVDVLASKGIVTGTGDSSFTPAAKVTRADFLVMLVRALGLTAKVEGNFSDVKRSDYYYEAVGIAKKLGIVNGVRDDLFDPNALITREDLMVMAARALHISNPQDVSAGGSIQLEQFEDRSLVSPYALQAVGELVEAGIVEGRERSIAPKDATTRAEAAVIVYRLFHK